MRSGERSWSRLGGTTTVLLLLFGWAPSADAMECEEARQKCAFREGCGTALHNYLVSCSSLRRGVKTCPEDCQHALIALTSTEAGQLLMNCECVNDFCRETKEQVEVCRPYVTRATLNETIVTCTVAQLICGADTKCSTALKFYHLHCKQMFSGHRCSRRCENSINILRRQEKAAKLNSCVCSGREDYDCEAIRRNMETMCFVKKKPQTNKINSVGGDIETNKLSHSSSTCSSSTALVVTPYLVIAALQLPSFRR